MLDIQSVSHEGALVFLDKDDLAFLVASLDQRDAFTKKLWTIFELVNKEEEYQANLPRLQICILFDEEVRR